MKIFAELCDILSKKSGSLKKIELISDSIKEVSDEGELYLFAIYLTGRIYPSNIQKTINIGKALIRDAIVKLSGITKEDWDMQIREYGESGEAVCFILENLIKNETLNKNELFDATSTVYKPNLGFSLQEFANYIDKLVETSGNHAKVDILTELFSQLPPIYAKYGVKIILQNLRIGVQEATVETAIAKAYDIDKKVISKANFYLGDIGEIVVRAKKNDFTNINFKLGHPIKAMLASAEVDVDEIFKRMNGNVWCEYKYDGVRAHIHKLGDVVKIFTRDQKRITEQFPEIVEFYKNIKPDNFLIDGEIVPFKGGSIQPFAFVQKRLGRKEKLEEEVLENPTVFIAYDFLFYEGETLFEESLETRRGKLEEVFGECGQKIYERKNFLRKYDLHYFFVHGYKYFQLIFFVHRISDFHDFFRKSKEEGREGLMVKNPKSTYESGKRGIHWLKYKQTLDPLDVVIIQAEYGEGKNSKYLSSFTFGVWDERKENLVPVGRVASGTTEADLQHFTKILPEIAKDKLPNGFKVKPQEILEVGFENIQISNRYSSGWAVRFPRLLRIRTGDKPLDEISTISDIKRIYEEIKGKTTK
jgi:DNA ligase-1